MRRTAAALPPLALLLGVLACGGRREAEAPALPLPDIGAERVSYPLRVAADGRRVVDRTGRPVWFQGDAPWHLFARLKREEIVRYLDDRQRRGFNALLVTLIMAAGYGGGDENAYGERPFTEAGDFSTPNEAYFALVDWGLAEAERRGFTVFLAPAYMGYECAEQGWCREMKAAGPEKMRAWGEWVGRRYRDRANIVWVQVADVDPAKYGALDVANAVAGGIGAVDSVHLNTAHCGRQTSAADCVADAPWLQINSTYSNCQLTPGKLAIDYRRAPPRPFVFIEGIYEEEQDWSDRCVRSQAYWALLMGASGHFFGHRSLWDLKRREWERALGSPGARSMQVLETLRRSRPWAALQPDTAHALMVKGYGDVAAPGFAPAAVAGDGTWAVAYLPSARDVDVDLARVAGDSATAWWVDPSTGSATRAGVFPTDGIRTFTPPSSQDWVLVLDDAAVETGAPGEGGPAAAR